MFFFYCNEKNNELSVSLSIETILQAEWPETYFPIFGDN
jgi:hypothetical protein